MEYIKLKQYRETYSSHYPIVFGIIYSKIGNREDAEDICHEVFIRFLKHFDEVEHQRAWLISAIKYEISNYLQKNRPKMEQCDIEDVLNDGNLAYENGFRDARIVLQEALENNANFKNEMERKIFDLVAIYNLTYQEAGVFLGLTKKKVEYLYKQTERRIILYLNGKGIKSLEDLI